MAKKTTARTAATAKTIAPKVAAPMKTELQDHHRAFSHIMYVLFIIASIFAAFHTFFALRELPSYTNAEYFFPIVAIMMLLWAFLFLELGHRIHTV